MKVSYNILYIDTGQYCNKGDKTKITIPHYTVIEKGQRSNICQPIFPLLSHDITKKKKRGEKLQGKTKN